MERLQTSLELQLTGNVAENWRRFKQRFKFYLSRVKVSMFLHVIGDEALVVCNNFMFAEGDEMKLEVIMEKS